MSQDAGVTLRPDAWRPGLEVLLVLLSTFEQPIDSLVAARF